MWIARAFTILGLLLKYGPNLWDLGVEVYGIVEIIVNALKKSKPDVKPQEIKQLADTKYDTTLVRLAETRGMAVPTEATRTQLRRDVWGTRKENMKKIRDGRGGRKPT